MSSFSFIGIFKNENKLIIAIWIRKKLSIKLKMM